MNMFTFTLVGMFKCSILICMDLMLKYFVCIRCVYGVYPCRQMLRTENVHLLKLDDNYKRTRPSDLGSKSLTAP